MVLLINACTRPQSRTLPLAVKAANMLSDNIVRIDLYDDIPSVLNNERLIKRDKLIMTNDFGDDIFRFAKQFKEADTIVIAAPYWDLSYPAVLKCYIENICVNGLTFFYNEKGIPQGLCKAKRLVYVTTAGGYIPAQNYGFDYIRRVFSDFFGINDAVCIKAEGLDIYGADVEGILNKAETSMYETILKGDMTK